MRTSILLIVFTFLTFKFSHAQCGDYKKTYIDQAQTLQQKKDLDQALKVIEDGITQLQNTTSKPCLALLGTSYLLKGYILRDKGQHEDAKQAMEKALDIRDSLNDPIGVVRVLNALSINEKNRADFHKALSYATRAVQKLNKLPAKSNAITRGNIYLNAANIFIEIDSFSLAELEYFISEAKKAYGQSTEDTSLHMAIVDFNLAVGYNKKKQWDKVEGLLKTCADFFADRQDTTRLAQVDNERGLLQQAQENNTQAKISFERSINRYRSKNASDEVGVNTPLLNLSELLLNEGKASQAITLATDIKLSSSGALRDKERLERIYVDAYKALADTTKLAQHLLKLDSIGRDLKEQNTRLLFNLKEDRDTLKEELEVSINKNKQGILFAILLSLLILSISIIAIRGEKRKVGIQKLDSENEKQEKKFQQKIAGILNEYNKDFSSDRNKLNRILHDVICPQIISIKRELEYYELTKKGESLQEALVLTDSLYEDSRSLINTEGTYQYQRGWLQNIELIINQLKRIAPFEVKEHFNLNVEEIPLKVGNQIAIISNVLLENIEKWAKAKQANINIIKENGSLIMLVEDDGVGFKEDETHLKTDQGGAGIGLKNVKYRVEEILGGHIKVESQKEEGTTITIEIPLK